MEEVLAPEGPDLHAVAYPSLFDRSEDATPANSGKSKSTVRSATGIAWIEGTLSPRQFCASQNIAHPDR